MFVLDTNTLVYYLRDAGMVASQLRSRTPGELAIPSVVRYELEAGLGPDRRSARQLRILEGLFRDLRSLPFDDSAAQAAAQARATLDSRRMTVGPLDILIAGTAIAHRGTLVTHNAAEFKRIPGLKIVDWY